MSIKPCIAYSLFGQEWHVKSYWSRALEYSKIQDLVYLCFYGISFAKEWILRQLAGPPATQLKLWTRWKWYLLPDWGDQKETRLFLVVGSLQVKKPGSFTMESLSFYINVLLLSQLDVDALVVFSLTLSLPNVTKGKFRPNFQISVSKIMKNKL